MKGEPAGTIVLAGSQTHGTGRRGSPWVSPHGGIWMSLIVRPELRPEEVAWLSVATSLAVSETIAEMCGLDARIKWPNDVLLQTRKVCGILVDFSTQGGRLEHVVIGVGVNLNVDPSSFPRDMRHFATSVKHELGEAVDQLAFLSTLLLSLEETYDQLETGQFSNVRSRWDALCTTIGNRVAVKEPTGVQNGTALGLGARGGLRVVLPGGREVEIFDQLVSSSG